MLVGEERVAVGEEEEEGLWGSASSLPHSQLSQEVLWRRDWHVSYYSSSDQ